MSTATIQPELAIPGYEFLERLGSGGYGEVWRAEVPGGLEKAVKIVFGRYDQKRASAELRALERIKSLRHPFLLSLERIEIIENRLVIVTELAECSLRDVFVRYRQAGQPGIPKKELLGYLNDTAEALDYLGRQHELQHLDVKPENLLVVSGHVKLADFGLVKDIYTTQASLVGGMTPSYAAPELFQGKASSASDQYSLAILYQEMLTGTLPFTGQSTAELTLQHLNELPSLEPLDQSDRFAISQALAKDPEHRFTSCREFVAALQQQGYSSQQFQDNTPQDAPQPTQPVASSSRSNHAGNIPERNTTTQVFDEAQSQWSSQSQPILLDIEPIDGCAPQNPPQYTPEPFAITPTVVIGVGNSAGLVLRQLRQQFADEHGDAASGLLHTLLLDTDTKSVAQLCRDGLMGAPLEPSEMLCMPLRRPHDYRNSAPDLLRWMSRRWLYNIPRSLSVEGIRPLGRLALIDHSRQVTQRLRITLREAAEQIDVEGLEEASGLNVNRGQVRVYLVGATAGGTAGGAMLDVAYLIRSMLERMDIEKYTLIGIAAHVTSREVDKGELGRVNTLAWLDEWHHFSQPHIAYPGDAAAGLPSHAPEVPPFDATYLVDMGDRITHQSFQQQISRIASYLLVDFASPVQQQLDACRAMTADDSTPANSTLRTFRLTPDVQLDSEAATEWGHSLVRALFDRWIGSEIIQGEDAHPTDAEPVSEKTGVVVHGISKLLSKQKLDAAGLVALCKLGVEKLLDSDIVQLLRKRAMEQGLTPQTLTSRMGSELIESIFVLDPQGCWCAGSQSLTPVAQLIADDQFNAIKKWDWQRAEMPEERLPGVRDSILWLQDYLRGEIERLARLSKAISSEYQTASGQELPADEAARNVVKQGRLRLEQVGVDLAVGVLQRVSDSLATLEHEVRELQQTVALLLDDADHSFGKAPPKVLELTPNTEHALVLHTLLTELDALLHRDYFAQAGGFVAVCQSEDLRSQILDWAVSKAVGLATSSPLVRQLTSETAESVDCDEDPYSLEAGLLKQGGQLCWVQTVPELQTNKTSNACEAQIATNLSASFHITEAWGVSPRHAGAYFAGNRRDYAQLASRIHTRNDIEWTSLMDDTPQVATANEPESSMPAHTQVIEVVEACE